jgi:hypothetical protein
VNDWGSYRKFVGFYWTLPVRAFGFVTLPKDPAEAAKASATIAYQRALVQRHVADRKGELVAEVAFLESGDRPSPAIEPEITRALKRAQREGAQLLYVDFAQASHWREHRFLQWLTSLAPVSCLGLPPEPIHVEGRGYFDPIAHFRASRRLLQDPDAPVREADRRILLEERVRTLLQLDAPGATVRPAEGARILNAAGLKTLRNNAWTADNLRQFLKAMRPAGRRVAVVGSRDYPARERVAAFVAGLPKGTIVVSGGARGVDAWAEEAARAAGLKTRIHHADWEGLGRRAGPVRNALIVADCDEVVAFWNGSSRGTLDTLVQAFEAGRTVRVFDAEGRPVSRETVMAAADRLGVLAAIARARHPRVTNPETG